MMEPKPKEKNKAKMLERIVLQSEAADRAEQWTNDLNTRFKGLRLTRSDVVNHLVLSHPPQLSAEECEAVHERYFDEVSFAAWMLKELKAAKERGEGVSLAEMYESAAVSKTRRPRKNVVSRRQNGDQKDAKPADAPCANDDQTEVK